MKNLAIKIRRVRAGLLFTAFMLPGLMACSQNSTVKTVESLNEDNSLSPYFIVLTEGGDTEQLPLKSTVTEVNIAGVIADVKVKQTYSNTGKNPIEAIYIFPASSRAAVYDMVMKIDEREIVAIVEEKQTARKMYDQAKQEGKTASLLEQQRPNVFQMNVANIMPGDEVEVTLSYTELLIPVENTYEFVYPTVVGPRYVSKNEYESNTDENWTANPYLEEGVAPTSTFDLKMNITTGIPLKEIKCETHKNTINFENKSNATLVLNEKNGGNRDFIVRYRLAGNKIESGVLTYEDPKGEKYFLGMMQPPVRLTPESIPPREYIFIVDVSGSMSGFPLEVSKSLMKELLSGLKTSDKFNIVLFAGGSNVYAEQSLNATNENIQKAIQYLGNLRGGGGTELLNALQNAMNLNTSDDYARSFVILTDGYVSVEKETFDYIRNNLGNANFFSFGIGTSVNRYIIEGMAHVGMGEPFIATNKNEAEKVARKMLKYISSPVLTQIKFKVDGIEAYDLLPEAIPDLFASRPIIIAGKYKSNSSGTLRLNGISGNEKYSSTLDIKKTKLNTKALKYLWAREKIRLLADYNKIGANDDTKNQIIALGKKYNLLTEFTSFVAIDSEVSNNTGQVTTVKQPLPLPQGVSNMAVGNTKRLYSQKMKSPAPGYLEADMAFDKKSSMDLVVFEEEEEASEEEVFFVVESMPQFQGGGVEKFINYVMKNLKYPKEAADIGIQGRVIVQFTVDKTGKIKDIKVIRGVDKLLDEEAIRVIKNAPQWIPGNQRGRPVDVQMTIPVNFKLNP